MKSIHWWKTVFINGSCAVTILLFTYTGISKIRDHSLFEIQMGQSPLLNTYAKPLSWLVPVLELVAAMLLLLPVTRLAGIYLSFFLMSLFTAYIYAITRYSEYIPCSCGGIIDKLSWNDHFLLNAAVVVILALSAIFSGLTYSVNPGKN